MSNLKWNDQAAGYAAIADGDDVIVTVELVGGGGNYYTWAPQFGIRAENTGSADISQAKRNALNMIRQRHGLASQLLARLPRS